MAKRSGPHSRPSTGERRLNVHWRRSVDRRRGDGFGIDRRVAALLLELARVDDVVDFGGPQTLLAQRLGVARQTVNTALRTLADRGLLVVHPGGRAATVDRAALAAHAAGGAD